MIKSYFNKRYKLNPNLEYKIFFFTFLLGNLKKRFFKNLSRDYFYINEYKFYVDVNDGKGKTLSQIGSSQLKKISFLKKLIDQSKNKGVFIDVGTSYGEFSSLVNHENIFYSYLIEPNKKVSQYLKKSLKENNFRNFKLIEKCLTTFKQKDISFHINKISSGSSSVIKKNNVNRTIKVENLYIEDFLNRLTQDNQNKTLFFKIDIEGLDYDLVKFIVKFFINKKDIKFYILFEFSENSLEKINNLFSLQSIKTAYCVYPKLKKLNKKKVDDLMNYNIYDHNYSYDLFISNEDLNL